jgi:hypothetical protein
LDISGFEARLPDNFFAVREAWMCTEIPSNYPYQTANSFYSQAASQTTIQVSPIISGTVPCTNPQCTTGCPTCMPDIIQAVYKTNQQIARSIKREYLLKPGNISCQGKCDVSYTDAWEFYTPAPPIHEFTPGSAGYDSFDIRDNKFVTNFGCGIVHMIFYATDYDAIGNQLIPDNYRIREFVEAFIKYKVFETLANQINDETFNQIQQKLAYYKQLHDEAFIMAYTEIKKQDAWTKQRRVRNDLQRFGQYELPNRSSRYGRGWNR